MKNNIKIYFQILHLILDLIKLKITNSHKLLVRDKCHNIIIKIEKMSVIIKANIVFYRLK